jgi:DNA-binding beta-propeller fold protein YncE
MSVLITATPFISTNTLNAGFPVSIQGGLFISQNEIGGTLDNFAYVVDSGNNRINAYTWGGAFAFSFGSFGTGNGEFSSPYDICTDGEFLYVTDTSNNRVQIFDMLGNYLSQFGSAGSATGFFNKPLGIAVDNNFLYVVDSNNDRFQIFQKVYPYSFVQSVGSPGSGVNQFSSPTDCAVDSFFFYINDFGNARWLQYPLAVPTNSLIASLPTLTFTATIESRSLNLTGSLKKITMSATMHESQAFTLVATLPSIQMTATEINGLVFSMQATLPRISMASQLDILFETEISGTLPSLTMQASIAEDCLYSLASSMPKIRFEAYLRQQVGSNFVTIVLNTDNFAVTEYNNYNFDSIAELEGKYYAVGPNGLVRLDGSNDNGTKIQGTVRFAQIDLHKRVVSRLVDAYLSGHVSGKVAVRIIQESQGDYLYMIEDVIGKLKAYRVKAPKNMRDRYVSYEISNVDGAEIEIEELSVISTAQPLRVR